MTDQTAASAASCRCSWRSGQVPIPDVCPTCGGSTESIRQVMSWLTGTDEGREAVADMRQRAGFDG